MRNLRENLDVDDSISYGDDLINLLKVKNGFEVVSQSFDHLKALRLACDDDFNQLQRSLQVVSDELKDMSTQRNLIVEQRKSIKRKDRDDSRAEKKLSLYASVTKVIPDIDDDPSKISGYMVNSEKKVLEKFKFETNKMSAYEICNNIWSVINNQ
ncbi:unnamed protein product [Cochlearia groenlandica]